ncbi:DUF6473 family protein [Shimia sp. SDUM112013]|uniref:DUF6473 family protein n=1 Tax=Shimia sp. SDUM112013 TaxID=3136160 RepID=UPI0032EDBE1F
MSYLKRGNGTLDYMPYRLAESRLLFRGPKPDLTGRFNAFLGGTETYGKFIPEPFPARLARETGVASVNFGVLNAGVDVFLATPAVLQVAQRARKTVIQVPCAQNLSNRYYKVHPRRNDRFVGASNVMKMVFKEVDFTEFHFTRHMLGALAARAPDRFTTLRTELQQAWVARMKMLINLIGGEIVLLWMSDHAPDADQAGIDLGTDPVLVNRDMVERLRPLVSDIVEVVASPETRSNGLAGMVCGEMEKLAAQHMLGPAVHKQVAQRLKPVLVQ